MLLATAADPTADPIADPTSTVSAARVVSMSVVPVATAVVAGLVLAGKSWQKLGSTLATLSEVEVSFNVHQDELAAEDAQPRLEGAEHPATD